MKKHLSIFMCVLITLLCTLAPLSAMATTENTNPTVPKTTTSTTKKETTTQKKTTQRKTTAQTQSTSGKLKVSSKRSTEGSGEGGKVTVVYTIENTGDVTAKSIKLKDPDIAGSKTIEEIASLGSGESKTVNYEATMTRDSTSTPTVTCTMSGSSRTFTGEPVKISLTGTSSMLSATLTSSTTDVQPNTPTKFSLVLKNNDTKRITGISVTDHTGKSIKNDISLDASSTTNVEFELTLTGDTNVFVNIKGKDSSGTDVSAKSNELAMKVSGDTVAVSEGLAITITADKTELDKKGTIQLSLVVQNMMSRPYTNVTIVDKATGANLQTVALLSGKDSKTYTSTVNIEQNTSFQYEAAATYEDGTAVNVLSNSLEIKIVKGSIFGNMTVIIVIIVTVVLLIIIVSVILYIMSKKEKEQNKSLGATRSEKYKNTPKKKVPTPMAQPEPQKPISTFTINDDAPPSFNTTPIQIPNENAFDDYGNDDIPSVDENNFNGQQQYSEPEKPNFAIDPDEPFDRIINSGSEPSNEAPPSQPKSNEPINYNDLDPD